jgi:hypothetical protein
MQSNECSTTPCIAAGTCITFLIAGDSLLYMLPSTTPAAGTAKILTKSSKQIGSTERSSCTVAILTSSAAFCMKEWPSPSCEEDILAYPEQVPTKKIRIEIKSSHRRYIIHREETSDRLQPPYESGEVQDSQVSGPRLAQR